MSARLDAAEPSPRADRRWLFASAVLDERTMELQVDGRPVELERKSLQVLMHLLEHAGEVVGKEELLAAVWPGRILSDSVITSCMARLRDALGDGCQGVIKTVHGFGYRLVAPVKVETLGGAARQAFEFKAGGRLPARPLWSLVERLGSGRNGETWLARHDKTRKKRVYKFATDGETLTALKRELAINRLLGASLGERPDFIHLLDWNVDEPPYFAEYDYVEDGGLPAWVSGQGGLGAVPLAVRVDLAAQVADALAAAHSVGVLHKDLKPSSVLVEQRQGPVPQVKLCEFGSGSVLDVGRLDRAGITRPVSFDALAAQVPAAAESPYLAPEVADGQPFTVQADIYALGVMLYQLAVGNFHKAPVAGWEQDIADEALREDIALALEGHPARRIADAGRLARRLRTLEQRRHKLEAQRAAGHEAERTRLQVEQMLGRRRWMQRVIVALAAGLVLSLVLYADARRALAAAVQACAAAAGG